VNGPLHLGVIASVASHEIGAEVAAEVVRRELQRGLGTVIVDFRTTLPIARPLDPSPWREISTADWGRTVHAVVVDERIAGDPVTARASRGIGVVVATDLFGRLADLAALLVRHLDPASLDTRRRMLSHLGVLPEGTVPMDSIPEVMPLRATDLYLVAERLRERRDPVMEALAGGDVADARPAIDDLVDRLRRLVPDTVIESVAQLRERAESAEHILAEERERHEVELRALLDRVDHAERLAAAARRSALPFSTAEPPAS
jgi:hypothetical protein